MANHKIEEGDIVVHKSDPTNAMKMVVIAIKKEIATCQWVSGNKKCDEDFPVIALKKWVDPTA